MTTVMPPGPVSCIGGTKYPHCIVLYCIVLYEMGKWTKEKKQIVLWQCYLGDPSACPTAHLKVKNSIYTNTEREKYANIWIPLKMKIWNVHSLTAFRMRSCFVQGNATYKETDRQTDTKTDRRTIHIHREMVIYQTSHLITDDWTATADMTSTTPFWNPTSLPAISSRTGTAPLRMLTASFPITSAS